MTNNDKTVGVFADMPFAEYLQIDAMNCSTLKKVAQSPAHAHHALLYPSDPTPALIIGDAVHALVLEPERFGEQYAKALDRPKRSKADKEAWEEWTNAHPNVTPLKPDDYGLVMDMADALRQHETAAQILGLNDEPIYGLNEVTMVWQDEETDFLCKGRADRMSSFRNEPVIADLKTTVDASPEGFAKSVARFGYDQQAAWYLNGANILSPLERRFLFVCVEKTPPHGVTVQELGEDDVALGAKLNRVLLRRWIKCVESGEFTAYPTDVISQRVPAYRRNEIDKLED